MEASEYPFVTVIMPIRNEEAYIQKSLGAVLGQDYPQDRYEIFTVDGMSTDKTRELIRSFQKRHPNLYLIDNPGKIVPIGLNLALDKARGEIIVRVDGHTIIATDYIRQSVLELLRTGADNVGGQMKALGNSRVSQAIAIATSSPFGVGNARFRYSNKEEWVDTVYLGVWRSEIFHYIGNFDEEQVRNQDDEFNFRLRKCGGKILLSPKIRSTYIVRSKLSSLWKQYFQYGFWKVRILQKHPTQMSFRHFVPPAFAASLLLLITFLPFSHFSRQILLIELVAYTLVSLAFSAYKAAKEGWHHLHLLIIIFLTLHLSYGLGFIWGLIKFARYWKFNRIYSLIHSPSSTGGAIKPVQSNEKSSV